MGLYFLRGGRESRLGIASETVSSVVYVSFPVLNSDVLTKVIKLSLQNVFLFYHREKKRHFCYLTSPELHPFAAAAF